MDLILYRDGFVKEVGSKPKFKRLEEERKIIGFILMECNSEILGKYYVPVTIKLYKKFKISMKHAKFKYTFVNGVDTGELEEECFMKYTFKYDNPNDLMCKISEIRISEGGLNDLLWVHEAWFCYHYANAKIQIKYRGKPKKTMTLADFNYNKSKHYDRIFKYTKNHLIRAKDVIGQDLVAVTHFGHSGIIIIPVNSKYCEPIKKAKMHHRLFIGDYGCNIDKQYKAYKTDGDEEVLDIMFSGCETHKTALEIDSLLLRIWEIPMIKYMINGVIFDPDDKFVEAKVKTEFKLKFKKSSKLDSIDSWKKAYHKLFYKK